MKVIVISGSRNVKGQTARCAKSLLEGVNEAGGHGEAHYLPLMKIERCRQCDDRGWGICRTEGRCVIVDDFAGLVEKLKAADAAVFATPVYFGDLSESMKAFLDRLRRTCMHENGKAGLIGKPAVGICLAGGGGGGAPECIAAMMRILPICGFEVADMIPARRQNLEMKQEVLKTTGNWLATPQQEE